MNEAQQPGGDGNPTEAPAQRKRAPPERAHRSLSRLRYRIRGARRPGRAGRSDDRFLCPFPSSDFATTRAIRRPVVEVELLRRYLNELHKIGSNINQTARRVNMGDTPLAADIQTTYAACRDIARRVTDLLSRNGGSR
jgi:hypothetical protein